MMMHTNTKAYKANLDKYINECIEIENKPNATLNDKVKYFMSEFDRVANYPHNINRYPNIIDRMDDYLMGIPFGFEYTYFGILQATATIHEIDEVPTDKEDVVIYGFNKHIASRIIKLNEGV